MGEKQLDQDAEEPEKLKRGAQYVRMSTEHQQYSTANQSDVIREYAARHGIEIVRTYADEGRSGLRIEGRQGLRQLIEDVQSGRADFEIVLAYDVSRWGRFQDADESAYYEYICKRAGIRVEYCAEQFANDGSMPATMMKAIRRTMAGELSRDLSVKVFRGQCRLIELGYRQGGPAGYGLRRMLIDPYGNPKGQLKRGERKSFQMDRVILVPGPEEEIHIVIRIYEMFVVEHQSEQQIADWLNGQGIPSESGRPWSAQVVHEILTNEKYIGNNIYNRCSSKLKTKRVRNDPKMWVRHDAAFAAIVDPALFQAAQAIIQQRSRRLSNEEMLESLKALLAAHGRLSAKLIDSTEGMPSSAAYSNRFGGLYRAYRLVGFATDRDWRYLEINRHLRSICPPFVEDVARRFGEIGASIIREGDASQLRVNGEFTVQVIFVRCHPTQAGQLRWPVNLERQQHPDVTVVVRMDASNQAPADYYLLPRIDIGQPFLRLCESNGAALDTYRADTLDHFVAMAARVKVEEVA